MCFIKLPKWIEENWRKLKFRHSKQQNIAVKLNVVVSEFSSFRARPFWISFLHNATYHRQLTIVGYIFCDSTYLLTCVHLYNTTRNQRRGWEIQTKGNRMRRRKFRLIKIEFQLRKLNRRQTTRNWIKKLLRNRPERVGDVFDVKCEDKRVNKLISCHRRQILREVGNFSIFTQLQTATNTATTWDQMIYDHNSWGSARREVDTMYRIFLYLSFSTLLLPTIAYRQQLEFICSRFSSLSAVSCEFFFVTVFFFISPSEN